jgi:hypothetical protein
VKAINASAYMAIADQMATRLNVTRVSVIASA